MLVSALAGEEKGRQSVEMCADCRFMILWTWNSFLFLFGETCIVNVGQ